MADPETDAAIAAKWPDAWAKANDPTLRNRSKARQQIRQRYRASLSFDAFKQANPSAQCGNCTNYLPMPHDSRMMCAAESDFHGYAVAKPDGLCMKWKPA
jgi:hypothetical protein